VKKKRPIPDTAAAPAAAAAASAKNRARTRRRGRRAGMRGHGDEYMAMNIHVDPEWATASDRGAGSLGFAGAARKDTEIQAAGLNTIADDSFGGGATTPMVPTSWAPDETGGDP
jgi:PPE-repeat protein